MSTTSSDRLREIVDGFTGLEVCALSDRLDPEETLAIATELLSLRESHPIEDGDGVFPTLREAHRAAVSAAQTFYDAASVEETNWTGWGDQIVPFSAEMRRVKAKQALDAIRDADPSNPGTSKVEP